MIKPTVVNPFESNDFQPGYSSGMQVPDFKVFNQPEDMLYGLEKAAFTDSDLTPYVAEVSHAEADLSSTDIVSVIQPPHDSTTTTNGLELFKDSYHSRLEQSYNKLLEGSDAPSDTFQTTGSSYGSHLDDIVDDDTVNP